MRNSTEVLRRRTAKAEAEVERIRVESEVPLPTISSYFPKFWARAGDGIYLSLHCVSPVHLPENGGQEQERHAGGRNAESVAVVYASWILWV